MSSVSTYLCPWGVDTVGEGSEDNQEEGEEFFDSIGGQFI